MHVTHWTWVSYVPQNTCYLLHSTRGLNFTWIVSRYLPRKLSAPLPENKTPLSILVYFRAALFCFGLPWSLVLYPSVSHLLPLVSLLCPTEHRVCFHVSAESFPRVFWGICCNLNDGGSEMAFVSKDSVGSVPPAAARDESPTIPSLVTCFGAMCLGPADFIWARVCCIMERSESHVIRERDQP